MKRLAVLLLPVILWPSLGWGGVALETPKAPEVTLQVFFSPNGGCTEAVVEALAQAKTDVKVEAYTVVRPNPEGPGGCPQAGRAGRGDPR